MKTRLLIFATLLGLLISCHKDDGPPPQQPDPVKKPVPKSGVEKSSAKQITGFAFRTADNAALESDVIGTIDQQTKAITATVPTGTDVTALLPETEVSAKASVTPVGMANFKDSLNYTVTAEDGSTAMYKAAVNIAPSGEKKMLGFRFLGIVKDGVSIDVTAEIDEDKKTVTAVMPSGTDITSLEPSIEISGEATVNLEGNQDFTDPVNYTVTAGNGTSATYAVTLSVALTEKEVLLLIAKENPGNTLVGWSKENNLEDFEGVTTNSDGKVILLKTLDKGIKVLPPEIGQLVNLTSLNLYDNELGAIPPEIGKLINLTFLQLDHNELVAIPPEIGQLANLKGLYLIDNELKAIPPEIGQLANLTSLILSENELETVPPEIGQLFNLEYLYLSFNELMVIPPEIGELINLRYLYLGNNHLENIPKQIGNIAELEQLGLSNNEDLFYLHDDICNLDLEKGSATDIDIVPDGVTCVGDDTIGF